MSLSTGHAGLSVSGMGASREWREHLTPVKDLFFFSLSDSPCSSRKAQGWFQGAEMAPFSFYYPQLIWNRHICQPVMAMAGRQTGSSPVTPPPQPGMGIFQSAFFLFNFAVKKGLTTDLSIIVSLAVWFTLINSSVIKCPETSVLLILF